MHFLRISLITLLFAFSVSAQSSPISSEDYDKAYQFALIETNLYFPFIHTFSTEVLKDGVLVPISLHVSERQASGVERQTFTNTENGKIETSYQLRTGHGDNVYCSSDGKT